MATHSSVLAWRIPWTERPGRLQSMGSHRVGHDWGDLGRGGGGGGHNSHLLLKFKKSSKSTIGVLERHFRSSMGSRVKVTSNCHISGSTTISRIKSYFSQIFSANSCVWQECQCWPMLVWCWTSRVDKSGLGTPLLAEIFLERYCSLRLYLSTSPPCLSPFRDVRSALQSERFFCLLLLPPFYSLEVFLHHGSWKTDHILVCASQMTWTNTMT